MRRAGGWLDLLSAGGEGEDGLSDAKFLAQDSALGKEVRGRLVGTLFVSERRGAAALSESREEEGSDSPFPSVWPCGKKWDRGIF